MKRRKANNHRRHALNEVRGAIQRAGKKAVEELLSSLERFEGGHELMTAILFDEEEIGTERAALLARQSAIAAVEIARETPLYTGLWTIRFSGTRPEVWLRVQREQKIATR